MSIVLANAPGFFVPTHGSSGWLLEHGGGGTFPEIRQAFYRLEQKDVGYLTDRRTVRYSGERIPVDFGKSIASLLQNPLPSLSESGAIDVQTMYKEFRLNFGEAVFNTTTGVTTYANVTDSVWSFYFLAGTRPDLPNLTVDDASAVHVLSQRPRRWELFRDGYDWLYVVGPVTSTASTDSTVVISEYAGGSLIGDHPTITLPKNKVIAIPIGGAQKSYQSNCTRVEVTINNNHLSTNRKYTFELKDCLSPIAMDGHEIYFREPMGNWSSLRFEKVESGPGRVANGYFQATPRSSELATRRIYGGKRVLSSDTAKVITVTRSFDLEARDIDEYVTSLLASTQCYIRAYVDGSVVALPFFIDSIDATPATNVGKSELTITGRTSYQYPSV